MARTLSKVTKRLRTEADQLSAEARERTVGYITGALGVVAGFAWNEAIKLLIETYIPTPKSTLLAKFVYAVIITLVVAAVATYLTRLLQKKQSDGV